jgi:alkylation response protein AidB-like acyl-CoA dehydrogenase
MVRHAAAALDAGSPAATLACAMAKRHATDACYQLTNDALQLLGGYGCVGRAAGLLERREVCRGWHRRLQHICVPGCLPLAAPIELSGWA